ncbi:hypothetical protein ACEPPN_010175 [Leptodophora sp. 'Broadleaf-Isolate-01']
MKHLSELVSRRRPSPCLKDLYLTFKFQGPEEITIFDPEAVVAMNGPGSNCTRADWYDGIAPLKSVANLRSPTVHDQRRRIWDKAFSANAVQDYDSRITKYAEQLNQIIVASLGRPVNLYDLFSFYTSDVMSDLSFGKSFGNLLGGKFHDSVVGVRDFMSVFGTLSPVPWFVRLGNNPLMQLNGWKDLIEFTKRSLKERMMAKRLEEDADYLDGDALVLIIVGSDSMATTLINLFANLSRYPKYQEHILKVEIQTLPSILDFPAVLKLPVLKSVIMETLRLWPPVPTRSGRLVPLGRLSIAGKYIPERTVIFAPRYTIARLESCFERATEFIPERWTTSPEMVIDK